MIFLKIDFHVKPKTVENCVTIVVLPPPRKEVRCMLDTLIVLAVSVLANIIADRICKYPDKR